MKKFLFVLFVISALTCCGRKSADLKEMALKQLPISLDSAMREYMQTVEKPVIKDIETIYDCDSMCVLQCKAYARDADGQYRSETIRYFFIKDTFVSGATGVPSYGDFVLGGKYLDKKGIAAFRKSMKDGGTEKYNYYLGRINPLQTVIPHRP